MNKLRIALVFNPFSYKIQEENLYIVQKYFGLFPPLSLAWVAAIIEKAGHTVTIIDARTLNLTKEQTLKKLKEFKPDILGFMMTTYMFPETLEWIRYLKKGLKSRPYVLIGGYNLRIYPKESVSYPEIDFGCVEHAYYTVPSLLYELESGNNNFENVPGLIWKKVKKTSTGNSGQTEIIVNPHPQKIDFNKFPNPARHLLPNELYAEFPTQRKNFTVMVTSLGCPYRCSFCEAGGTAYSPRSPETVVNEMEECYTKYGIREIDIFDYEFTAIKSRVIDICSEIKRHNLEILWACRSRVDTLDEEMLYSMKMSGCDRIYFGIESGCQEILDRTNKGITLKQIENTISLCKKLRIKTLGFFLIGAPGETQETVMKTLNFAKKLNLDYVQFSKCLAKPLTPLWRQIVKETGKDYWRDWVLGKEIERSLPRPWTVLTNKQIDRFAKMAYINYHSRPLFLLKSALDCQSITEFLRKIFAYLQMVFSQSAFAKKIKNFKAYSENIIKVIFTKYRFLGDNLK